MVAPSLPSRERELKHASRYCHVKSPWVAPLAGARIETDRPRPRCGIVFVAPLAGARIETLSWFAPMCQGYVAPLAGARIETSRALWCSHRVPSLPSRERELKPLIAVAHIGIQVSLPSRERELKQAI